MKKFFHRIGLLWNLLKEMDGTNVAPVNLSKEMGHEISRLKLLAQFSQMKGKGEEIAREWQKIQQNEHDEYFAFQVTNNRNELDFMYRKGIREGIQWCIDRFC